MMFEHAGIFTCKNRTKFVLFLHGMARSTVLSGPVLGVAVVLNVVGPRAAYAEDYLYLNGSQATQEIRDQQSFSSPGPACSALIAPSPVCVDGGLPCQSWVRGLRLCPPRRFLLALQPLGPAPFPFRMGEACCSSMRLCKSAGAGEMV